MRTFTPAVPEMMLPTQAPVITALCIILTDYAQLLHNVEKMKLKINERQNPLASSGIVLLRTTAISNPFRHQINSLQLTTPLLLHDGRPLRLFMFLGHG